MSTYAYMCNACRHLAGAHRLIPDGDLRDGPYRCRQPGCSCEQPQDGPFSSLNKKAYDSLPDELKTAASSGGSGDTE